jgi:hypothetical protein
MRELDIGGVVLLRVVATLHSIHPHCIFLSSSDFSLVLLLLNILPVLFSLEQLFVSFVTLYSTFHLLRYSPVFVTKMLLFSGKANLL